jgi:glycosyltransferase involved in cell wall biosynthesis
VKVLLLTRYDRLAASTRQRSHLYREALAAAGITAEVSPFLSDAYVRAIYTGRPVSPADIVRSYLVRLRALTRLRQYDLVWIEKEALPWLPAWIELGLVRAAGTRIVVDYDDAVFHNYDRHRSRLVRRLLGRKIDRVMAAASLVTAGSAYLADRAHAAGARAVADLPTVVDLRHYPRTPTQNAERAFTIGWIGSPLTGAYLERLRPALTALAAKLPVRLVLVGAAPDALAGLPVERRAWSAQTEAAALAGCDVGIMPLPDAPWERGKCGYKLIQYMAAWLPVVASPVGANKDIVVDGVTGLLAATDADWVAALRRLHDDPVQRRQMGIAGRLRAEQRYSLAVAAPRLVELLRWAGSASRADETGPSPAVAAPWAQPVPPGATVSPGDRRTSRRARRPR